MDIKRKLVKFNENSLPENFVAITTQIVNNVATHAGILIRHKSINYLHHFPGYAPPEVVENFDATDEWYIYKIADFIEDDESEVGSFLSRCKKICAESKISYGFIIDNSFYNESGNFVSRNGLPEFGTCVGFCINTLYDAIIDLDGDYFLLDDWDSMEIDPDLNERLNIYTASKYPRLDWALYNSFKKRIKPIEYLSSAFVDSYPIRKIDLSNIEPIVQEYINERF